MDGNLALNNTMFFKIVYSISVRCRPGFPLRLGSCCWKVAQYPGNPSCSLFTPQTSPKMKSYKFQVHSYFDSRVYLLVFYFHFPFAFPRNPLITVYVYILKSSVTVKWLVDTMLIINETTNIILHKIEL